MSEGRDRITSAVGQLFLAKDITNIIECACQLEGALYRYRGRKGRIDEYAIELFNLRKALEGVFGSDIPCDGKQISEGEIILMKNLFNYYCCFCKDKGTIRRGFLWWKAKCPVCKGDPIKKFREDHPAPHMPPPNTVTAIKENKC